MSRAKDINVRYREIEKGITLTVISGARQHYGPCPACGADRIVFHCQLFREPSRPIADFCKDCAISRAGGIEKIWVRTEERTGRLWRSDERRKKPGSVKSGTTLTRSDPGGE